MNWQEAEERAYELYKEKYDDQAIHYGGSSNQAADIFSPKYNYYIEVKKITSRYGARAGQFTQGTAAQYKTAGKLIENPEDEGLIKDFVREHYEKMNVGKFMIYDGSSFKIQSMDQFLDNHSFSMKVYEKRGGPSKLAKKYYDMVLAHDAGFELRADGIYSTDSSAFGSHFEIDGIEFYIGSNGLIKKRGVASGLTWQVDVNEKEIEAFIWD